MARNLASRDSWFPSQMALNSHSGSHLYDPIKALVSSDFSVFLNKLSALTSAQLLGMCSPDAHAGRTVLPTAGFQTAAVRGTGN